MTQAVAGLLILLTVIVLLFFRRIPAAAVALLGCAAFALCGLCSFGEAFSGFSDSVVILVSAMMVVGAAMKKTGLASVIGGFVVRTAGKNARLFILVGGTAAALLSAFLSNTAINIMFLTVIGAVSTSDKRINRLDLVFPIVLCTMFGGVSTLVGSTTQMTAQGVLQDHAGFGLDIFDYTLPGVMLFAVFLLYALFIGLPLGKRIWGARQDNGNEAPASGPLAAPADKGKLCIMILILTATVVLFIGNWVNIALTAVLSALACILLGCVDFKTAVHEINFAVVFLLAGFLGISKGISACGTTALLGDALTGLLGAQMPPLCIFAVFVAATMLVSNFISNSAAVLLFLPAAVSLCQNLNLNIRLFALGIVFAASLSFSSPLANAQMGLVLSAGYRVSDYIRYTWLLDMLILLFIIFCFPLIIPIAAG